MNVAELIEGRRVCICCGSGGVGKTTTAAAIALGAAQTGKKVAVVTIDPAKRLANSLGLDELSNQPERVDPALLAKHQIELRGELWAMMLDAKRTFDELVERLAPDARTRDEVLANRIYQELSSAVAGSQEYTAIAKLYELDRERDFDLLVLDTPPSRNALDFLDAPDRLTNFLEGRALRVFLRPTGIGMRVVGRGTSVVFSVLRRITGVDLLADLSTFFQSLSGMIDGFRERAVQVKQLLADPATTFLLVTSPEREPVDEGIFLWHRLKTARMSFGGLIVNRMHHEYVGDQAQAGLDPELSERLAPELAERVAQNLRDYGVLAARDRANVARLMRATDSQRVITVPHLDEDVHDVGGLVQVNRYLFATDDERRRLLAELVA